MNYQEFLEAKKHSIGNSGFDVNYMPDIAFDFQQAIIEKIEEGKAYFRSADKDSSHPTIPLQDIKGVYQVVKVLKDFTVN